jgi:hypothetical protein
VAGTANEAWRWKEVFRRVADADDPQDHDEHRPDDKRCRGAQARCEPATSSDDIPIAFQLCLQLVQSLFQNHLPNSQLIDIPSDPASIDIALESGF